MGSNTLSSSIICPSARLSCHLWNFCDLMSVYMVICDPFWTRIKASQRWNPTLEINTNTFPVQGASIAMHLLRGFVIKGNVIETLKTLSTSVYEWEVLYLCIFFDGVAYCRTLFESLSRAYV